MSENKHIFISYAGEDAEIAVKTINGLEKKEGYNTWYYERDSLEYPGEIWLSLIAKAVMKCNAFILFISSNSIISYMVDREVNFALEEKKKILPLFYNITPDEAKQEKPEWALIFSGQNKLEITLSNVAPSLLFIVNWLKRIEIQPNLVQKQIDEAKPKEEEKKIIESDKVKENELTEIDKTVIANLNKTQATPVTASALTIPSFPEIKEEFPKEIIGKIDDAPMVLIPAGEFEMGSNDGEDDEKPVHTVYLDAFYMDKYEVTNALYKKFMDATGYKAPAYWNDKRFNDPQHPVVGVSWKDANEYCKWAGKRLPTEAEWEKAARGGLVGKKYPWGDTLTHNDANYSGKGDKDIWKYTSSVGSFPPNGYGLYDMAGNVYEWCADWYGSNYYASSPKSNPAGQSSGLVRVLRGGSWSHLNDSNLRTAYRNYYDPTYVYNYLGFRCSGLSINP